eukprot:m51a1_g1532 hypothetical protein (1449) ;mRNA; r:514220-523234
MYRTKDRVILAIATALHAAISVAIVAFRSFGTKDDEPSFLWANVVRSLNTELVRPILFLGFFARVRLRDEPYCDERSAMRRVWMLLRYPGTWTDILAAGQMIPDMMRAILFAFVIPIVLLQLWDSKRTIERSFGYLILFWNASRAYAIVQPIFDAVLSIGKPVFDHWGFVQAVLMCLLFSFILMVYKQYAWMLLYFVSSKPDKEFFLLLTGQCVLSFYPFWALLRMHARDPDNDDTALSLAAADEEAPARRQRAHPLPASDRAWLLCHRAAARHACAFLLCSLVALLALHTPPARVGAPAVAVPEAPDAHAVRFVQVSDVHVHRGARRALEALRAVVEEVVPVVGPRFVLATGDLVCGRSAQGLPQQHLSEWRQYAGLLAEHGLLNASFWVETLGNHDMKNYVGRLSRDKYALNYTAAGADIYRPVRDYYVHVPGSRFSYKFVLANSAPTMPVDAWLGYMSLADAAALARSVRSSNASLTLVAMHHPLNIVWTTWATDLVWGLGGMPSNYAWHLPGHLHRVEYAYHRDGPTEASMASLQDRGFRIGSLENGRFAFSDVVLGDWPYLVLVNPKSAMMRSYSEPPLSKSPDSTIRALIFHNRPIKSVVVKVDGKQITSPMKIIGSDMYTFPWDASRYEEGLHTIQFAVVDDQMKTKMFTHQFSLDGSIVVTPRAWLSYEQLMVRLRVLPRLWVMWFVIFMIVGFGLVTFYGAAVAMRTDLPELTSQVEEATSARVGVGIDVDAGEFKSMYNKSYSSPAEEARRFSIFQETLREIERLNREVPTATFDINEFADLTKDEFAALYTNLNPLHLEGLEPSEPLGTAAAAAERAGRNDPALPSSWKSPDVTPVQNQEGCKSCWAFTAMGLVESAWHKATGETQRFSPQSLIDCDHQSNGCDKGSPRTGLDLVLRWTQQGFGAVLESDYPYHKADGQCYYDSVKSKAVGKLTSVFGIKFDEATMNQKLIDYGPIIVQLDASSIIRYKSGVVESTDTCLHGVNHGVLLVGWGQDSAGGYWLMKNSWGTKWGENGFFRLRRGRNACLVTEMNAIVAVAPQKPLSVDLSGPFALRTHWGTFLSAQDNGAVKGDRRDLLWWETFTAETNSHVAGTMSFKSYKGSFLSVDPGNDQVSLRGAANTWEAFTVYNMGNGKVALRCLSGKYLSVDKGPHYKVTCDEYRARGFELFEVVHRDASVDITGAGAVALRTHWDTYISAQDDGSVKGDRREPLGWEMFTVDSNSNVVGSLSFMSHRGGYLSADPGNGEVRFRDAAGPWESFVPYSMDNGKIALRCLSGRYLSVDKGPGFKVTCSETRARGFELFEVLLPNMRGIVALRTHWGTYISALDDGTVQGDRREPLGWETFTVDANSHTPASVSFKSHRGTFLAADPNNGQVRFSNAADTWESFVPIYTGNGKVALRCINGRYLSVDKGPHYKVTCTETRVRSFELFDVVRIPQ